MQSHSLEKILKIIKIILWLIPVFVFILILNQHFVLNGKFKINYDIIKGSKLIRNFASKEPDKLIGTKNSTGHQDYFQLITRSPVYFDVKVSRPFQKATVTLKYQNPDNQPSIKLGVKQGGGGFYNQDLAYYNSVLEKMPDYWSKLQEGDLYLWQKDQKYYQEKQDKQAIFDARKKKLDDWKTNELIKVEKKPLNQEQREIQKQLVEEEYQKELNQITEENKVLDRAKQRYSNINEFLNNLPEKNKISQFNYDLAPYIEMPNYQKSSKTTEINRILRGKHEIYTYIGKGEDLNFTFTAQDINRQGGEDNFKISVLNNKNEKVKDFLLPDDGDTKSDGKVYPERALKILMENTPFGVYRLVMDTTDDVFIKKIVTFQHLFMFKSSVFLADSEEYKSILGDKKLEPTTLYTNSATISASTAHDDGFQKIEIDTSNRINYLNIDKIRTDSEISNLTGVSKIISPKNDVMIRGDFFAFSQDQLFDLNFTSLAQLDSINNTDDYNYIIAYYPKAKQEGDWLVASTTVTADHLYFNQNTVNFIFDLPGLYENNRTLKIKELTIQFEKEPITLKNFWPKFSHWLKRNIKK